MKFKTILSIAGIGGIFALGFFSGGQNNSTHLHPRRGNLSHEPDWYRQQAQRIISAWRQLFSLAENRVIYEVVLQLENSDDWKQLYNEVGQIRDGWRYIDLIYMIEQMNETDRNKVYQKLATIGIRLQNNNNNTIHRENKYCKAIEVLKKRSDWNKIKKKAKVKKWIQLCNENS